MKVSPARRKLQDRPVHIGPSTYFDIECQVRKDPGVGGQEESERASDDEEPGEPLVDLRTDRQSFHVAGPEILTLDMAGVMQQTSYQLILVSSNTNNNHG